MLEVLADGDMRRVVPGVSDVLATRFHLTDDESKQMLPSGAMPTFIDRTHWAATYMSKAGLVERPKRGHVCITQRGRDLLATEPDRSRIPQCIVLIDGERLASLMREHGIGVRPRRTLDVKGVDEAYFEGEA